MNQPIKSFIIDFLAELVLGNTAIFAGAGLSVPAGYVDWRALLRPLSKDLDLDIDLENDLVSVAQFHVNSRMQNRHKLHEALLDALSRDAAPTENHQLLSRLPITTFWTTNYDKLIEQTLNANGKVVDVKSSVPQLATTRPGRDVTIFKMHGDIDRPDEAVVTKDDYEKYSREREPFITALAGDLVKRTFLFLGFSFTDPNLEHVLSQVRLNFTTNQRQHYAVFRTRKQITGESDAHFAHHRAKQAHVIEDLKRFNVRVLLVDEYSEITDILRELVRRYRRRTVFISTSALDFGSWGHDAVVAFAQELGRVLIADGTRIATGVGAGVGDAIFSGALREVMRTKGMSIEDALVLRPFPQSGDPAQLAATWKSYREEIISHAGIALFLFGNKERDGKIVDSDGLVEEFDIARAQGVAVVPIGATGSAASDLAIKVIAKPDEFLSDLDASGRTTLAALENHRDDLMSLIPEIVALIRTLQGKA